MPVQCICQRCGTAFSVYPSLAQTARFCSKSCKVGPRADLICETCGTSFTRKPSEIKGRTFCSKACHRPGSLPTPVADRFWPKVNKDGPIPLHVPEIGPCWVWTGSRLPDGRGLFRFERRCRYAAVVAYILTTGHEPPPETPHVLHHCDGGSIGCVRPAHLFAGTHAMNMDDKVAKDRQSKGRQIVNAKLSDALVIEIRARYAAGGISQAKLADEYSVDPSSISHAISGRNWRHVV